MSLEKIPVSTFAPRSADEFRKCAVEYEFLDVIELEHSQIVEQPYFGSVEHFSKPENNKKNRYEDIPCWDETRVKITPKNGNTDYIHANYVDCYQIPKKYVATQGPLKETVDQFWQLVWEQNSRIIVMLTELQVDGKEMCAPYWYPHDGKQKIFQADTLSIKTVEESRDSEFVVTTFDVSDSITGESRIIKHYMYLNWLDNGVPSNLESFMQFILDIDEERHRLLTEMGDGPALGPIVVLCSDGVERTGTFCALDSCFYELLKNNTVSIPETVLKIRQQRRSSVSELEQYDIINRIMYQYSVIIEMFDKLRCASQAG